MKVIHYLIAIFIIIAGIVIFTGLFNDSHQQSEIDIAMLSVKTSAINAVNAVTEGAADAVNAADEMGSMAEIKSEGMAEELSED
ncbi:MAG: hypothetical protein HOJ88_12475 [Proteobacteria bacterium]|jgi:hypothetical protein|nr:hypothetical protein [Pseudomonadota bacterium]